MHDTPDRTPQVYTARRSARQHGGEGWQVAGDEGGAPAGAPGVARAVAGGRNATLAISGAGVWAVQDALAAAGHGVLVTAVSLFTGVSGHGIAGVQEGTTVSES